MYVIPELKKGMDWTAGQEYRTIFSLLTVEHRRYYPSHLPRHLVSYADDGGDDRFAERLMIIYNYLFFFWGNWTPNTMMVMMKKKYEEI